MKKRLHFILSLFCIGAFIAGCNKDALIKTDTQTADATVVIGETARPIEEICDAYFKANTLESKNAEKIISVTNEFMAINKNTKEFGNKKPTRIQPICIRG